MKLTGTPLQLAAYPADGITNPQFKESDLRSFGFIYLPPALAPLMDEPPVETRAFIDDDNRGAILPDPIATLDGQEFYLSVKGVGSAVDPFSSKSLDRAYAAELSDDPDVRERLLQPSPEPLDRVITGELWLRGSPYGGQGLEHATTAMNVSQRADLTSVGGFLIGPVVRISYFPPRLEERIRHIHWYRRFRGRIVQELRLVPSNVRIYFHARNTVGGNIRNIFDMFSVDSDVKAFRFETNFLRSAIAMLTLFARTMIPTSSPGTFRGLDFHDVWLDKDAVLAPDGSVYFVDLEGIEEVTLEESQVREKMEDQVFRSLYEFMFAYEQIEQERARRFGDGGCRKHRFEMLLENALRGDPCVTLQKDGERLNMVVRSPRAEPSLYLEFPLVD